MMSNNDEMERKYETSRIVQKSIINLFNINRNGTYNTKRNRR